MGWSYTCVQLLFNMRFIYVSKETVRRIPPRLIPPQDLSVFLYLLSYLKQVGEYSKKQSVPLVLLMKAIDCSCLE